MRPRRARWCHAAVVLALTMTAACQPRVDLAEPVDSNADAARGALARLADDGPVPVVVRGDLAGLSSAERDQLVASALAQGVRGLDVTFSVVAPDQAPDERLVVVFNPSASGAGEALCAGAARPAAPRPGQERLAAAFCQGAEPLGTVEGTVEASSERARERLIWQAANSLFPDDYESTYGLGILPDWLSVGVGGSFGF